MLRALEAAAGGVVVAAVLSDIFRSVILPRAAGRTLRLGPWLGRQMLWVWLAWARRRGRGGHSVLGALGPLLIVVEMVIWILLLVFGYSLMLDATQGLRPTTSYGDALHAAASVFATTGMSGQEAHTGLARLVVALAGFSGLTVVTLVVTFLLSVTSGLMRRESLVVRLRARLAGPPSGPVLLETLSRIGARRDEALPAFFESWEAWCADVLLTHRAYPILVYFRSTDEDSGWMASLGAVLDAAALVIVLGHEDAGEHARVCHEAGVRLVDDLARQLGLRRVPGAGVDEAAFRAAFERLEAAGYEGRHPEDTAWANFHALRACHAPALAALTRYFGEQAARF